jgi:hypothetical protein
MRDALEPVLALGKKGIDSDECETENLEYRGGSFSRAAATSPGIDFVAVDTRGGCRAPGCVSGMGAESNAEPRVRSRKGSIALRPSGQIRSLPMEGYRAMA